MVGLDLPRLHDVRVVAQPIEELRAVGLGIDRLQFDAFNEHLLLRALGLGVDVKAASALPDSGQAGQWPEILQRVNVEVRGFGVDVLGIVGHGRVASGRNLILLHRDRLVESQVRGDHRRPPHLDDLQTAVDLTRHRRAQGQGHQ